MRIARPVSSCSGGHSAIVIASTAPSHTSSHLYANNHRNTVVFFSGVKRWTWLGIGKASAMTIGVFAVTVSGVREKERVGFIIARHRRRLFGASIIGAVPVQYLTCPDGITV